MTVENMISDWYACESIKAVSRKYQISEGKVKKILISAGIYETPVSRAIVELRNKGYSQSEIANILNLSKTCVDQNTPYTKGAYKTDTPSKNALRIRKYRSQRSQEEGRIG